MLEVQQWRIYDRTVHMGIYYIFFSMVVLTSCLGVIVDKRRIGAFDALGLLLMVLFAGLRHNVGTDYPAYLIIYRNINDLHIDWEHFLSGEYAFRALNYLTKILIGSLGDYVIFVVVAAMTYIPIYIQLKQRSYKKIPIYLTVYFLFGFYTMAFNISRQWIAISVLFVGVSYLIDNKLRNFIFSVLLAGLFHQTAFLVAPFFLLAKKVKPTRKLIAVALAGGSLFALVGVSINPLWQFIGRISPRYASYLFYGEAGIGYRLQIIVYVMLLMLFMLNKKALIFVDKSNEFYLSVYIISLFFVLAGLVSVPIGRLATYFNVFVIFLLGDVLQCFSLRARPLVGWLVISCLIIWFALNAYFYGDILPYESIIAWSSTF